VPLSAVASAETHCETAALETARVIKIIIIAKNCAMALPISLIPLALRECFVFLAVNWFSNVYASEASAYAK
jgi:hypothetical protein